MRIGSEQIQQRSLICQPAERPPTEMFQSVLTFVSMVPLLGAKEPTGWFSQFPGLSQANAMEESPACFA